MKRGEVFTLTASMLRSYKSCPRKYELEYVEQLKRIDTPGYFEAGTNYHKCVEDMLLGGRGETDNEVVGKMAEAFMKYIPWQNWDINAGGKVEHQFDIKISRWSKIAGKIDAITAGGVPIEHKTSGGKLNERYVRNLMFDDQVSFYLLALSLQRNSPVTKCIYTVCAKPTIKQTQKEDWASYLARVEEWYSVETETKIGTVDVVRSEQELVEFEAHIREMIKEMRKRKFWYRNPSNCSMIECQYAAICQNYDPQVTSGFVKKERQSEELCLNSPQF